MKQFKSKALRYLIFVTVYGVSGCMKSIVQQTGVEGTIKQKWPRLLQKSNGLMIGLYFV